MWRWSMNDELVLCSQVETNHSFYAMLEKNARSRAYSIFQKKDENIITAQVQYPILYRNIRKKIFYLKEMICMKNLKDIIM